MFRRGECFSEINSQKYILRFRLQRLDPLDDEDFVKEDHVENESNDDEWIEEQGNEMIILKIP